MAIDPNQIIGDTVYNPERVKPLPESECRIPIPKPHFFIIGSAKSGSTTLASVLGGHPDCCHSAPKETNFFTLNYERGFDWYRGNFAHYNGESVVGEGSVSYCSHPFRRCVVDDLYEYNPEAKLIYIVRNPYDKLVSGWKMATIGKGYLAHRAAMRGFEDYVLHEEARHPQGGEWQIPIYDWDAAKPSSDMQTRIWLDSIHYQAFVNAYRRRFPSSQLKVMFLEDWKADQATEAASLCQFLGLDPAKLGQLSDEPVNRAEGRTQVRGVAKLLADAEWLTPLRRLFPMELRRKLRRSVLNSKFGKRPHVYPEFQMSAEFKQSLLRYLQQQSASFLKEQGKPASFWDFGKLA